MIVAMTLSLAPSATLLADCLQRLGLTIEWLAKTEVRLLLGSTVLCIGLFALVINLALHIKYISRTVKDDTDEILTIKDEIRILKQKLKDSEFRRQFLEKYAATNRKKKDREEKDFVEKHNFEIIDNQDIY